MRKEITPDMYNYNKFPGPVFVSFDDQVKSEAFTFRIVTNTSDSFDATAFTQRFSEVLLKYDYIVGDWGNEQLRLRGFYKDERQKSIYSKISRLDDYLKEYCNFGCAYFVLENPIPQEVVFEEEDISGRRRRHRRRPRSVERRHDQQDEPVTVQPFKKKSRDRHPKREKERHNYGGSGKQGHFTIRQKGQA